MAWLCVDGKEIIFEVKPKRSRYGQNWQLRGYQSYCFVIYLKKGTIEKIVGRKMFPLDSKENRDNYVAHLRDSAERLKIMSILLTEQAKELEQFGEIRTTLYFPEADD